VRPSTAGRSALALSLFPLGGCLFFVPDLTCGNGRAEAGELCYEAPRVLPAGDNPRAIEAGDFDLDGDLDLAVANGGDGTVSLYQNRGRDDFGEAAALTLALAQAGANPQSIAVGDLNGDALPDIATSNEDGGTVSVFFNAFDANAPGALAFAAPQDLQAGIRPYTVKIADLNGDGLNDLAVANALSDNVGVFFALAAGAFDQMRAFGDFEEGAKPRAIEVADFDGDALPDIATADQLAGEVSILLNAGGNFFENAALKAGDEPFSVHAVDADGDGDLDVFAVNRESKDLTVLLNDGTGEFASGAGVPLRDGPEFLASGDFDGDGRRDLIAVNNLSNDITALLVSGGAGDLGITAGRPLAVGRGPHWVRAIDLNGDGVDDLVNVNGNDDTIGLITSAP
jgi:hypothetical protein